MRCFVEPSPAGGYFVRLRGEPAPVSHHDTEEEAEAAAAAYERGLAREDTVEHVTLRDGSEALIRAVRPEDKPLFVAGWKHLSGESVRKRFLQTRPRPQRRRAGVLHRDRPRRPRGGGRAGRRTREGVGVARYVREADRPHVAEAAVTVIDAWQGRGLAASCCAG